VLQLKRFLVRIECFLIRHKWNYVGKDGNWLFGGHFFYECDRCGKTKMVVGYRGGFE
jgi:hypothetical protein